MDIKLPPHDATATLKGVKPVRLYSEAKVRAAIEADRKRRGDPVAWQKAFDDACKVAHLYHTGVGLLGCMEIKYDSYVGEAPQPTASDVLPGEAIFGFAAWLTSLKTPVTFSECHGAAIGADLALAYNASQGFIQVREDFHKRLKPYPKYEPDGMPDAVEYYGTVEDINEAQQDAACVAPVSDKPASGAQNVDQAPQITELNINYKQLYEQMCDRCGYLDEELAKYTERAVASAVKESLTVAEPVAFSYELATTRSGDGEYIHWSPRLSYSMPNVPEGSIRNLLWLYAPPPPTDTVDADSVRRFSEWLNSNRNADVSSVFHEIVAWYSKAPQPQQWASVSVPVVVCVTCNGSGIVDDGEIDCYENGEPYEHGPVKCVKDCPDCTTLPTKK